MTIKYKLVAKRNPRGIEAPAKIYASSVTTRKIDIDELSKIARSSPVARADVFAVLIALIDEAVQLLANGNQISFGKLGRLTVNFKSDGAETEDESTQSLIRVC